MKLSLAGAKATLALGSMISVLAACGSDDTSDRGVDPQGQLDTANDANGFDFESIDGSRVLTDAEVQQIVGDYGFVPEIQEAFVSLSQNGVSADVSVLDETLQSGTVPFIGVNGRGLSTRIFDSWIINPDSEREVFLYSVNNAANRTSLDGERYVAEGEDIMVRTLQDAIDRANGSVTVGPEHESQVGVEPIDGTATIDASTGEVVNDTEAEAPDADASMRELLSLSITETELLQPGKRAEVAIAAFEASTGQTALTEIVMAQNTNLGFFKLNTNAIYNAVAETGDARILWALYNDVQSPTYVRIVNGLAADNLEPLMSERDRVYLATDLVTNESDATATLIIDGTVIELTWNGKFYQFD